ncbi:MAG: NAD-dependent epimerase/dehydratase family protein [Acutalibacteraceae bacterium]|uniref:NAD-dependent epimerase/dehydratase family protein n=1 Tax=Hominenteromicrobium sp. TaxID=3073581 RepID=UPI001E11495F|nr:NAD(P)-dependent oxidoreductase [Clostridiales bacterium]MEE0155677.1 NAD-dependent epimerase/dehydratase family protein [Acutalibacteraceae bacterium]
MQKVIITGANGFIGRSLVTKLIGKKVNVVAIDVAFENSILPESEYLTKIQMSLDNTERLIAALSVEDGYDVFYHLAWQGVNGVTKADPFIQLNNAQMALKCAKVAKDIGCGKFLCAGTIAEQAVNSLPHLEKTSGGMMYGAAKHCTHLMLETYCKSIGLDFVWMQFSNIYGAQNKTGNLISYTLGEILSGREALFGSASQPYDFIFVDDLLEAVYRLGDRATSRNTYYIGSGAPRVLKEYLLEVGRIADREVLIQIGKRPDDGIVYTWDMFDTTALVQDIGEYVTKSFTERIQETVSAS